MRLGRGPAGGSVAGFMRNSGLAWVVLVVTVVATFSHGASPKPPLTTPPNKNI